MTDKVEKVKRVWHTVPRRSQVVPYGYQADPEDPNNFLLPVPEELEKLEEAKVFLKRHSYKEVAEWLSVSTGRSITAMGLYRRIKSDNKRKHEAGVARHFERKWKEAAEKARKIEETYPGGKGVFHWEYEDGTVYRPGEGETP